MLNRSLATRIFLIAIAAITVSYTVKDWMDFATCGAVQSCLDSAGIYQNYTKFSVSFLLTCLAFYYSSRFAVTAKDGKWLKIAFVFSLMADVCFRLLGMFAPDFPVSPSILGICCFMLFQSALIYRHSRLHESDESFPKALWIPVVILVVAGILLAVGVIPLLLFAVGAYAAFLITSLCVGCKAPSRNHYSAAAARLVKIGMIVFFLGDVLVGLALATSDDHSVMETVAAIANNFIWLVYVPAQILLIKSCGEK